MGLNFRCFRGYNGFRENYSTIISNAHACPTSAQTAKFIQRKLCTQISAKFKSYIYGSVDDELLIVSFDNWVYIQSIIMFYDG